MDVLVCNGLGIYCGMKTLAWLSMKPYQWQGLWNIPTYKYDFMKDISLQTFYVGLLYLFIFNDVSVCTWQGEDKAYSIPVHTLQLGQV